MTLLRLVRFPEEIDATLPHDPFTYDCTTYEGMEKDEENAESCRDAVVAILDYKEQHSLLESTEHDTAAELYLRGLTFYNDRFGRTLRSLKARQDAEELEQEARSKMENLLTKPEVEEIGTSNNTQQACTETSGASAVDQATSEGVVLGNKETTPIVPDVSSVDGKTAPSKPSWAELIEEEGKPIVSGTSWASIASLGTSNTAHGQVLPVRGSVFERKSQLTGKTFFSEDKGQLKGLNCFAIDTKKNWPTSRAQDSSRRPIFKEPELKSSLEICPKTGVSYLSMRHAQLTYHPRLRRDPAQHRQWMEDHGFYNTCDEFKAQRRGVRNFRGPKCDHGWPCCCSNQSKAPKKYTWSDNHSHEDHCEFGIRCNNMTLRTRQFFDFCVDSGLHDGLPSVDLSRSRATTCRPNKQKGSHVPANAPPPGVAKSYQNGGSSAPTSQHDSASKQSSNATAHANKKAKSTSARTYMQEKPQPSHPSRKPGRQSNTANSSDKDSKSTAAENGSLPKTQAGAGFSQPQDTSKGKPIKLPPPRRKMSLESV